MKIILGMLVALLILVIIYIITVLFEYIILPIEILTIIFGAKSAKKLGSKLEKSSINNWNSLDYSCLHLFIYGRLMIYFIIFCEDKCTQID